MARQFIIVESPEHGEVVDGLIADRIREVDGTVCNQWSGVWTDGVQFGVLWGAPASDVFGFPPSAQNPNGDPSLVIVEDKNDAWEPVPAPEPEVTP